MFQSNKIRINYSLVLKIANISIVIIFFNFSTHLIRSALPRNQSQIKRTAAAAAKSLQSWPTLCDPIDRSPLGSSVSGILQARILEWVAIAFSNT